MSVRLQKAQHSPDIADGVQHGQAEGEIGGRLIRSQLSYFDQYRGCSGELHVHFRWQDNRAVRVDRLIRQFEADYCVVLSKLMDTKTEVTPVAINGGIADSEICGDASYPTTDSNKLSMLISVFETTDDAKDSSICLGPQVIRLQPYDQCQSFWRQPFDGSLKVLSPLGVIDHKISVTVRGEDILEQDWETSGISASPWNAGDDDVVQCTAKVMYEITEHDANHGIRLLGDTHAVCDVSLAIWEPDTSELIRMSACVPPGFSIDVYHVLLGTLDLQPPRVGHMVSSSHEYRERKDSENAKGARDPRAHKGRVRDELRQG